MWYIKNGYKNWIGDAVNVKRGQISHTTTGLKDGQKNLKQGWQLTSPKNSNTWKGKKNTYLIWHNTMCKFWSKPLYVLSFTLHIKPFMPHIKSNTQLWVKKGNFIHKVPKIKQLNNWWSCLNHVQFNSVLLALALAGPSQLVWHVHKYSSIVIVKVSLNTRQQEQIYFSQIYVTQL